MLYLKENYTSTIDKSHGGVLGTDPKNLLANILAGVKKPESKLQY